MAVAHSVFVTSVIVLLAFSVRSCTAWKLTGNVALKSKVVQSSTWPSNNMAYSAVYAVDGKNDEIDQSCACTTSEANPWLRVELPRSYRVARVVLGYPKNCCQKSLTGAEIHVGDSLKNNGNDNPVVAVVGSITVNAYRKVEYSFNPVKGRYVNVMLPAEQKYLLICELEVYAIDEDDIHSKMINLALKGRATQSSLTSGYSGAFGLAQHAVDGNQNPDLDKGSCSHTQEEKDPWWRVDLLDTHTIVSVSLTNRGDCCADRLDGAVIHVGDFLKFQLNPVCDKVSSLQAGETKSFSCKDLMNGRYVTIVLPGENRILALCEVEVYGFPINKTT